ncbi:putative GPI-anchored protein 58 [Panicum miliaceum]|uniref:GPI-anchored protein 58 n=1 Tax=Panicum miliaceum TaxID=4540 RepID=A0A3L6QRU7_PANMI|nr:putative GPI-anchored protein 58 [Panicum miliaceum]
MASPADEALPALPPIKTAPLPPPPCASASASPSAPAPAPAGDGAKAAAEEEEENCEPSTPTSEESRLRPAARKPPLPSPARVFVAVPRDLSTVFRSLPPKKRIRVS